MMLHLFKGGCSLIFLQHQKLTIFILDSTPSNMLQQITIRWPNVCNMLCTIVSCKMLYWIVECIQLGLKRAKCTFNPLTPRSDQDRISPYNIITVLTRQVMKIKKYIKLGIISWSNSKFSDLTLWELYGWQ